MKKRATLALFGFFLLGFLLIPGLAQTQDAESEDLPESLALDQKDAKYLLSILFDELNKKWLDMMTDSGSSAKEQAVLITLRQALRREVIHYAFWELPKQAGQGIIKAIYKIAVFVRSPDQLVSLLNEFEKMTVDKAKSIAIELLMAKEIRVAQGQLTSSYPSCSGKTQKVIFPYIITYEPISFWQGKLGIAIYSSKKIEPPLPVGDSVSTVFNNFWLMEKCEPLSPFIVQIRGEVEKTGPVEYKWIARPEFEIEFPEYVPEFDFSEPSFLDKIEQNIEEQFKAVEKVFDAIKDFGEGLAKETGDLASKGKDLVQQALDKIKLVFGKETGLPEEVSKETPEIQEIKKTEEIEQTETPQNHQPKEISSQQTTNKQDELLKIREQLDDISEQIDLIAQKIAQLQAKDAFKKIAGASIEEKDSIKENEEEQISEKDKEEKEFLKETEDILKQAPVLCKKDYIHPSLRNKVIFNEIAWMGSKNSSNDEWIELKNISNQTINLSGWQILDKDNQIKIIFAGDVIPRKGFLLLERTDDNSAPYEKADLIYTGALDNQNEALYLFNSDCRLEDMVRAEPDWSAGDNKYKKTMERSEDLSWHTGILPEIMGVLGTPKQENTISQETGQASAQTQYTPHLEPSYCSRENLNQPFYSPVILNEISWMGSKNSSNDEWIELKNISEQAVSLNGWQILDKDSQIKIIFAGDVIPRKGFLLLEKTNDESVPDILADKIYTGALNNQDEFLRLFDSDCHLIDEIMALPDWPAGDNTTKKTMERSEDLTWHTFTGQEGDILGTPKAENTKFSIPLVPGDYDNQQNCEAANYYWYNDACHAESLEPPEEPDQEPLKTVVINEISWMGTMASSSDEWIELYNNTATDIDLSDWTLRAEDGVPEIILQGIIPGSGFYLLERTDDNTISDILTDMIYTGALTNEGEILRLKDVQGNLIDKVDCSEGWFAGQNEGKITMERIDSVVFGSEPQNWADNTGEIKNGLDAESQEIFGTPKAKNSVSQVPEPEPDLIWDHCQNTSQGDEDTPNETVLLSMINGFVESLEENIFVTKTEKGKGWFYINANTRLFDVLGQKLSEQEDFSFADYLKAEQEIKILYAEYGQICLASEIWLK